MEDLEGANSPPAAEDVALPESNADPQDPLAPEVEEESASLNPPFADPHQDQEATEDTAPDVPARDDPDDDMVDNDKDDQLNNDDNDDNDDDDDLRADDSDALSEVDEAQFDDFDPNAIAIEERPRVVDANGVALLGKHKRKRDGTEGEGGEKKRKRKEGRREKPKRSKKRVEEGEDDFDASAADGADGGRRRRKRGTAEEGGETRRRKRTPSVERDSLLTPEERRKKEFSRLLDAALAKPKSSRSRKAGIDLEASADAELEDMRRRMAEAAQADTQARDANRPAMQKLQLLPEVVALLNRNTLQQALVDPDINLLEAVRFFLEPLNDGSLPAYNIQRDLFSCLAKLPITKDALVASGIGKVVHFYTRSPKAEQSIKRQAERLVGEWTRPILKRTDDYRKREFQEADYDPVAFAQSQSQSQRAGAQGLSAADKAARAAAARKKALEIPMAGNRARVMGGLGTYTIVPRSNTETILAGQGPPGSASRRLGARAGDEMFKKLGGGGRRR
ncbi:hypothetical protein AAFC00_005184 [Neodothiora populina]|uniref:TFIIS N-terminal domain-containing protein n=1 Tax=Neodothiora populina TaxID=2781224 RepID=A0ABR3PK29_9PEZI